jgi:hypothetical protein
MFLPRAGIPKDFIKKIFPGNRIKKISRKFQVKIEKYSRFLLFMTLMNNDIEMNKWLFWIGSQKQFLKYIN